MNKVKVNRTDIKRGNESVHDSRLADAMHNIKYDNGERTKVEIKIFMRVMRAHWIVLHTVIVAEVLKAHIPLQQTIG